VNTHDDVQAPNVQARRARRMRDFQIYRRLVKYVVPMWPAMAITIIGYALANASEAYFARLFGDVVEALRAPRPQDWWWFPSLMLIAVLGRGFGDFVGEYFLSRVSFSMVHTIRCELFDALLGMPSADFDRSARGHLVSRITFNVAQLRDTATDASKTIIQDGSKVLILLGAMFLANFKLSLIFVAIAPIVVAVVGYASRRFRRISRRIQNSMGDVTHVASEAVNGYRVVRTFGGEAYERDRFVRASDKDGRDEGFERRSDPGVRRDRTGALDLAVVSSGDRERHDAG
jgi:subfamily B ATP-binding cassette protein MsbA